MRVITMIVIVSILLVISIIDFKIKIIPNQLNVLLFISGIWSGFVFQEVTFLSRFLGVFSVSIPMFILAILCSGGLGGGDVKLMAASGVLLGIKWSVTRDKVEYICCLCGITFRRIIWIFSTDYKACEAKGLLCAGTFFVYRDCRCVF